LRYVFPHVEPEGFQLLSMAHRLVGSEPMRARLDWCDSMLLTRVPRLQNYCRYMVLTLRDA
jgi:hypothetical protein